MREIDVVLPPLVPFLYANTTLEAPSLRVPQQRPHLAPELWPEIAVRAKYESLRDLALAYGVSHETIRAILRRMDSTSSVVCAADRAPSVGRARIVAGGTSSTR